MALVDGKAVRSRSSLPPSTAMSVGRRKMKVLLTSLVAKYLYGCLPGSRRTRGLTQNGHGVSMHALLTVPNVEPRVKDFLCKARLEDVLESDDDLVASQTVHYNTVSSVLSVGYIFELSNSQRARFVVAARKSLRRMRRAMDHMVRARRRYILNAIWGVARIRMSADNFGPLECSAKTGRPELFNRRFFVLLNKAVKRKSMLLDSYPSPTSS
ncbi:hypothetical protein BIW11_13769 [Tropilaelaps mercedesae]|uniref:Uncharacterized protein n=1 Tax=Tropilaelaps mercedesae TaxID=418985 RepID=A0A1V9X0E6_9ACAR|nr:hypothetical protein BIW11_13769 [Tropilaelaps mercedesae]